MENVINKEDLKEKRENIRKNNQKIGGQNNLI